MVKSRFRALLEAVAQRAREAEEEAVPVDGLTSTHAAVLAATISVGRREGVSGIARLLEMEQSSITWNIQKLERLGLLMRVIRIGSKVHSIIVTRHGADILGRIHAAEEYVQDAVLSHLVPEERVIFLGLLARTVALDDVGATAE